MSDAQPTNPTVPENGAQPTTPESGGGGDGAVTLDAVMKRLDGIEERIGKGDASRKTLTDDVVRLRKRLKGDDEPTEPTDGKKDDAPAAPAFDLAKSFELADALAALPEGARKSVREMIANGADAQTALQAASYIKLGIEAAGNAPRPTPTGGPETGAPPTTKRFDSYESWQKFKEGDRNGAVDYLSKHPDFNPSRLPGGPLAGR